jgi:hypothetical protein
VSTPGITTYRHTQTGYPVLAGLGLGLFTQTRALLRDARAGKPRLWMHVPGILTFAALMLAFARLTVTVEGTSLSAGFGAGLARRRIDLRTIEKASIVSTPWFAGWGIRLTPSGWLYNAWGSGAVRVSFSSGKRFTIGTDEPEALLAAIQAARAAAV